MLHFFFFMTMIMTSREGRKRAIWRRRRWTHPKGRRRSTTSTSTSTKRMSLTLHS